MNSTGNGHCPTTSRDWAAWYIDRGFAPLPLPARSKKPALNDWTQLRISFENLDQYFPPRTDGNIGLLLGTPSGGLVDVDLDAMEAVAIAPALLPQTDMISGRAGKPRSHYWYQVDTPPAKSSEEHKDIDGEMLVELRSTGAQTVVAPSLHKDTGEPIVWHEKGEPAHVDVKDLLRAVREIAAVALLARHWPKKGSRHDCRLFLAGGLLRGGWPEEGAEQFLRAVTTAAKNDGVNDCGTVVRTTAEKLQEHRSNAKGWPSLSKELGTFGADIVECVRNWLGLKTERMEIPIPAAPEWPAPPAEEAFHGLPGRIVRAFDPVTEADPAALLIQVLVVFGNIIGRTAHFQVEGDIHYCNEFAVLVGKTSKARKGTSWSRVYRLSREAEEKWAEERIQSGLSSGEGLIWAVRDPIQKRERVKEKGEVRYEEVEADPGIEDKRLQIYEPEWANVLKQTERQGNTLSAVLRPAWDGLNLRTLTKNSPAMATGAHVSLVGHITADELRRYLTATESANGFGNRHLFICADRSKLLPEGGMVDASTWETLRAEMVEAIAFARQVERVQRDAEARAIWHDIYADLSAGKPGLAGAMLARGEAHVMRLAMIFAVMDLSPCIRADHLLAALAVWDYADRSIVFIFGDSLGDHVADELLRLLRASPGGLTRTQIRDYFQRNASAERLGQALGLLLQNHLAHPEQVETGGRPAEKWIADRRG